MIAQISFAFATVALIVTVIDVIIGLTDGMGEDFLTECGWPLVGFAYVLLVIAIVLLIFK